MPNTTNIDKKRAERARRIDRGRELVQATQGLLDDKRRRIIKSSVVELVTGIKQAQWTAYDVVLSYIAQAIKAHDATNCLTEILFEEGLNEAKIMDEEFRTNGAVRGGLHGVPLTFKIEDFDNTIGFTSTGWVDNPATQDAELVAQARSMGAIIIAKTNVPQTMMSFECINPLWGQTLNPYSKEHTSGGSSGGEAAVLRFSGSALGFGSDIGGSLRIPTSYCGIYSLKPTDQRFSERGAIGCVPGFVGITTVFGPMARSVADVKRTCELFFGAPSSSPSVNLPPVKYRTDLDFSSPLRIGYFKTDRYVRASPACQRAVQEAVDALREAKQECVEINPPDVVELLRLFIQLTAADGYATMLSNLETDQQEPALFLVTLGPRLPAFIRAITNLLVNLFIPDTSFTTLWVSSRPRTVTEFWAASASRIKANSDLQHHLWASAAPALGLDAIVCPVQALPAVPHGAVKTLTPLAAATIAWNVVECPVGVVPVTRVDPVEDALPSDWLERGLAAGPVLGGLGDEVRTPSYMSERAVYGTGKRLLQPLDEPVPAYDAKKMAGLPVGVQIVGRPWEDEKVVYVMEVLDKALGERGFGPGMDEEWQNGSKI